MANTRKSLILLVSKQEGDEKLISYEPFWNTLKNKNVSQYQLIKTYHVSAGQLSRMRDNKNISTHTINMLCEILDCRVEDILVYEKKCKN